MKRYEIAGLKVDMEVSGQTLKQAKAYERAAKGSADITIHCDPKRILVLNPSISDEEEAQYLGTGAHFSRELLQYNGTFLHASAVIAGDKAYLFSAPSGTGKSTHTEKWCRLFGARYLNDDKPALRLIGDTWMAYGTPWSGKYDLSSPGGAPVAGIAFLKRGQENSIRQITPQQALPYLLSQSLLKLSKEQMQIQLTLVDSLLRQVPLWELTCRNDDAAAQISYAAMTGGICVCE